MPRAHSLLLMAFFFAVAPLSAQSIRGLVLDKTTAAPLAGATVDLPEAATPRGAICDSSGHFTIRDVPAGRYQLRVQYFGYDTEVLPDVLVNSGKDAEVQIDLEESLQTMQAVTIVANKKDKPVSRMAKVSATALNPETVARFSGGRCNVARMAANYAGVAAADDYQNQIVVRGNSPVGLLWRLEGVPIPNPSHLGTYGNTGGSFNAINPNLLSQSDFLTGAFPAEFGNTTAGVMDMNFRSGNKEKFEFMGQIGGWSGVEALAEGPVMKQRNGSFILGYRYSFVDLFRSLGVRFGESFVPQYQDLNWKIDWGSGRHRFAVFGLAGQSHIFVPGAEVDPEQPYNSPTENDELGGAFLTAGLRYQFLIDSVSFLRTVLSYSGSRLDSRNETLDDPQRPLLQAEDKNLDQALRLSSIWQRRHTKRITLRAGTVLQTSAIDTRLLVRDSSDRFVPLRDFSGQLSLVELFAQMQYKVKKRYSVNIGVHSQYLPLNGRSTVEPRGALKLKLPADNDLILAYGYHTQVPSLQALFYTDPAGQATNRNLDFLRSHHLVLAWVKKWPDGWRSRLEAYSQWLSDIPVHRQADAYSLANLGAGFDPGDLSNLVSAGSGQNYGLELTVQKNYRNGFYALFSLSGFESNYKGSDGVRRNTAFNTKYIVNALAGKEFPLTHRLIFTVDTKISASGGRWYTPIDLDRSIIAMREIVDESQTFALQYPAFFRWDLKAGVRLNRSRLTHTVFLDFTNLSNRQNIFGRRYFRGTDRISTQYQLPLTPDFVYRIQF